MPSWIRIRIRNLNADPDPATQINVDPDTDPKPCRGAHSPAGDGGGIFPPFLRPKKSLNTLSSLCMNPLAPVFQVNVGQELLPSLLHTARCFKIKGLDNVQTPPGLLDLNVRTFVYCMEELILLPWCIHPAFLIFIHPGSRIQQQQKFVLLPFL